MSGFSRRHFFNLAGSATAAVFAGRADAAMGPNDKFDLVIKGGDVLDPSQSLRGKRDIGIRWGVIEAIENEIPAARISKSIDASGKLVKMVSRQSSRCCGTNLRKKSPSTISTPSMPTTSAYT